MSVTIHRVHHPWVNRLGRLYVPDAADANYPLRAIMAPTAPRITPWQLGPDLSQLKTPECVAFTGREWLNCEPNLDPDQANPTPQQLYDLAQKNDGIPGAHDGSNDRGLMKGLQQLGLVDAYHWAQSVAEAVQYVITTGPLCCGSDWMQGMFTPDANGFVQPLGPVEGGHEYLCYWYNASEDALWFQQSWGTDWNPAFPGRFKMKRADVQTLFGMGMDFCAALVHFPRPILPNPPRPPTPKPRKPRRHL